MPLFEWLGEANAAESGRGRYAPENAIVAAGTHDAPYRGRLQRPTHGYAVVSETHGAGNK